MIRVTCKHGTNLEERVWCVSPLGMKLMLVRGRVAKLMPHPCPPRFLGCSWDNGEGRERGSGFVSSSVAMENPVVFNEKCKNPNLFMKS